MTAGHVIDQFARVSSDRIPHGWTRTTLGEATTVNPRSFDSPPADDDLVSFVPMAAVEAGSGRMDASLARPWKQIKKGYTPFQDGDVLFAKITPCMENGKAALARGLTGGRGAGSTEFHVVRSTGATEPKFVLHFLLQESFRRAARANMKGTAGQLRVPANFMESAELPLPPLPEQRRIVAEIEKQFTRLEAGVAALRRVQANLHRYRAAVLKAACEGRLVPTEAETRKKFETGEQLLQRILKQRRENWAGKGKYKEPAAPNTTGLPKLPEGWCWATLDALAEIKGGITKDQNRKFTVPARSVPYLRVANVQRGRLDLTEVKEIVATEDEIQELALKPGDLLFNEGGDRDKLGRGWVWNGELPECIHQNHVFRARLFDAGINPKLVSHYANTFGQKFFFDEGKHTTNLASISMSKLKGLPVPIPPAAEQERIVAEVERRLSVVEELSTLVENNLKRATRLRQSVLQEAFAGRLVK